MGTTALEAWLQDATRRLAKESAAQVRAEIADHYESAREAALVDGADPANAARTAVASLGDAKVANRQYRRVLLTATEANILRMGDYEARLFGSRRWLKWALVAVLPVLLASAGVLFFTGWSLGDVVLAGAIYAGLRLTWLLPVYTPTRSRVCRAVKWVCQAGTWLIVFRVLGPPMSWLFVLCVCQITSVEFVRHSIRRKLPVAAWPKHLYL